MTDTDKLRLKHLVNDWLDTARRVDDRFALLVPAQAMVAVSVLESCAEQLESILADEAALDESDEHTQPARRFAA